MFILNLCKVFLLLPVFLFSSVDLDSSFIYQETICVVVAVDPYM